MSGNLKIPTSPTANRPSCPSWRPPLLWPKPPRISGFNERTLRRWLDDDDFRAELARLRQESAELARRELQGLMLRSVSVLSEAMDDPDKALRLRAARYALSFAVRICETEKLSKEIQDLEDTLSLRDAQNTT